MTSDEEFGTTVNQRQSNQTQKSFPLEKIFRNLSFSEWFSVYGARSNPSFGSGRSQINRQANPSDYELVSVHVKGRLGIFTEGDQIPIKNLASHIPEGAVFVVEYHDTFFGPFFGNYVASGVAVIPKDYSSRRSF